jgi:hypothetical protein
MEGSKIIVSVDELLILLTSLQYINVFDKANIAEVCYSLSPRLSNLQTA